MEKKREAGKRKIKDRREGKTRGTIERKKKETRLLHHAGSKFRDGLQYAIRVKSSFKPVYGSLSEPAA
jgi:hypothetical protein